jgi:hypothetical protein
MSNTHKQSSVFVDPLLVEKGLALAKARNLPGTLRGLLDYLLKLFTEEKMQADYNPESFKWEAKKRTSITYDRDAMSMAKTLLKRESLSSTNDFIINFLLINFINS